MTLLKHYLSDIEKKQGPAGGGEYKDISKRSKAEANLLYSNWCDETSSFDSQDIQQLFQKVNLGIR